MHRKDAYSIRWTSSQLEQGYEIVWGQSSSGQRRQEGIMLGNYYLGSVFGPIQRVVLQKDCVLIEEKDSNDSSPRYIRWDGPFCWSEQEGLTAMPNGYRKDAKGSSFSKKSKNWLVRIACAVFSLLWKIARFVLREFYSWFKRQLKDI